MVFKINMKFEYITSTLCKSLERMIDDIIPSGQISTNKKKLISTNQQGLQKKHDLTIVPIINEVEWKKKAVDLSWTFEIESAGDFSLIELYSTPNTTNNTSKF